eukprot:TRINITY_DN41137_c0_g1_i1.p1 TRINITY_DN41137_c0_g1~~TRINITY_DN41137_c0_g1_i1.p1  ORF type:complete len:173 (-),score=26.58 TRINITY_DN41137_c0_g1_i1:422-940(-)
MVDGLEAAITVADVRALVAAKLECGVSSCKLMLCEEGNEAADCLLKDEEKLEELSCRRFVVIKTAFDPSLLKLSSSENSEYDEGQTDFYKSSTLVYADVEIWRESSHKACHIGGFGGSTHVAALSADNTLLIVKKGSVQRNNGELYKDGPFAPKTEEFRVETLLISKGLIDA